MTTTSGVILGDRFVADVESGDPNPFKVAKLMLFAQGQNGGTDITFRIRLWDSALNLIYSADYPKSVPSTPGWVEFVTPSWVQSFSDECYGAFEEVSNTGHVRFYYDSPAPRGIYQTWRFSNATGPWTKAAPTGWSADYIFSAEIVEAPEPLTLATLVGGGLFLLRTRRRR